MLDIQNVGPHSSWPRRPSNQPPGAEMIGPEVFNILTIFSIFMKFAGSCGNTELLLQNWGGGEEGDE